MPRNSPCHCIPFWFTRTLFSLAALAISASIVLKRTINTFSKNFALGYSTYNYHIIFSRAPGLYRGVRRIHQFEKHLTWNLGNVFGRLALQSFDRATANSLPTLCASQQNSNQIASSEAIEFTKSYRREQLRNQDGYNVVHKVPIPG